MANQSDPEVSAHSKGPVSPEEALRESERRYDQLAAQSRIVTWEVDAEGLYTYVSHVSKEVFGYHPDELVGKLHFYDLHPDEGRDAFKQAALAMFAEKLPFQNLVNPVLTKAGDRLWVSTSGTALLDAQGNLRGYQGSDADITERREAEEALRRSEERYRLLFDRANDGIFVLALDGHLLSVNKSLARMHGYSTEEMLLMNIGELDTPETSERVPERMQRILAGEALTFEVEHYHKDGYAFPLEVSASLVWLGEEVFIQSFHRDITARKKAEAEKAALEGQLRQAQKLESIGRLAGGVAHDFNNMLAVILGYSEIALKKVDLARPLHDELEAIHNAAKRSADLTRQLLVFARKQLVNPQVLDLNDSVGAMLKMLRRVIGEDVKLAWNPQPGLWPVKIDPSQVDQMLANLVVNARDAITGVGNITISTKNVSFDAEYCDAHPGYQPGDFILLAVHDTGCGMDSETLSQIFEPFFTTKSLGQGTGLGLATVYGATTQASGFLRVHSEVGVGSVFSIYLPRQVGEAIVPPPAGRKETPSRRAETILVVEDELAILAMLATVLEEQGYVVLAASTPLEAVRIAHERQGEIHLLLTDVIMPEMNGSELANRLLFDFPRIKQLFISGYAADFIGHHGVLSEGVPFLQKPFATEVLLAKVRQVLDT